MGQVCAIADTLPRSCATHGPSPRPRTRRRNSRRRPSSPSGAKQPPHPSMTTHFCRGCSRCARTTRAISGAPSHVTGTCRSRRSNEPRHRTTCSGSRRSRHPEPQRPAPLRTVSDRGLQLRGCGAGARHHLRGCGQTLATRPRATEKGSTTMVTSNGRAVPPPTDEQLDATLWRVHETLTRQLATSTSVRTNHRRKWRVAVAAAAAFAVGLAIGGAALPALTDPAAPFEVQCFDSSSAQVAEITVDFNKTAQVAAARQDPAAACGTVQIEKSVAATEIVSIVNRLINQGAACGVVTSDDGGIWSFQSGADGTLSVTSGAVTTPMSADCVSVHVGRVTPPVTQSIDGVACAVDAAHARVYPGSPSDASTICQAHGLERYAVITPATR